MVCLNRVKLIACRTLEDEIRAVLPESVDCDFMEYALHSSPERLREKLLQKISEADGYETLLFGYGLCSNGVAGLKSEQHVLVIPRVHDCISLLLGSRKLYDTEFRKCPGTYYLSKGWIDQKGDPLSSYERYRERYGDEKARWIIEMEYANYKRLVYIHTVPISEDYVEYSKKVAAFLGLEFVEIKGSLGYLEKLVKGEWDRDFIVCPPGKEVQLYYFI